MLLHHSAEMIITKGKSVIPLLVFKTPGALLTMIFSHGNATDCGAMYAFYSTLATELKINVVAYDYTGYGASRGMTGAAAAAAASSSSSAAAAAAAAAAGASIPPPRPTEAQTYKDIEAVYEWCVSKVEGNLATDPGKQIILYGQSVGSGPSCFLASKRPIAGLVLHSPIMSGIRVLTQSRLLACCDIFPNIDRITNVTAPVFVIHGEEDKEVNVAHGHGLHKAVPPQFRTEPWWVPNRGHNDVLLKNEREFLTRMKNFLQFVQERQRSINNNNDDVGVTSAERQFLSIEADEIA